MTKREFPTVERLRQVLRCDPEAGKLYWLPRGIDEFPRPRAGMMWNTRYSGKEALYSFNPPGYLSGSIDAKRCLAHRVMWALVHVAWPAEIDHINGIRTDNRISNLREATRSQNRCNSLSPRNTSGYKGVWFHKQYGKWEASINMNKVRRRLGYFDTPEEASAAYVEAAKKYHGEFARFE